MKIKVSSHDVGVLHSCEKCRVITEKLLKTEQNTFDNRRQERWSEHDDSIMSIENDQYDQYCTHPVTQSRGKMVCLTHYKDSPSLLLKTKCNQIRASRFNSKKPKPPEITFETLNL